MPAEARPVRTTQEDREGDAAGPLVDDRVADEQGGAVDHGVVVDDVDPGAGPGDRRVDRGVTSPRVNDSRSSGSAQSLMSTRTTLVVSPGAKLSVPPVGTKSRLQTVPGLALAVAVSKWTDTGLVPGARQADHQIDVAVALADDHVGRRGDGRRGHLVASLAPMTTTPSPSRMVAPVGLLRVSATRSAGSAAASSAMSTTTFLTVSPGAKVSVPLAAA